MKMIKNLSQSSVGKCSHHLNSEVKLYNIIKSDKKFCVIEVAENVVLKQFKHKEQAESLLNRLQNGAVFDGFTPRFFLRKDEQINV